MEEADCLIPNGILESLVDKAYAVRVDDQDRDNNLKLTVYDTSSNNQDVNINELLKSKISKNKLSASRHTVNVVFQTFLFIHHSVVLYLCVCVKILRQNQSEERYMSWIFLS